MRSNLEVVGAPGRSGLVGQVEEVTVATQEGAELGLVHVQRANEGVGDVLGEDGAVVVDGRHEVGGRGRGPALVARVLGGGLGRRRCGGAELAG